MLSRTELFVYLQGREVHVVVCGFGDRRKQTVVAHSMVSYHGRFQS
jgi:hypothetical protein